MKQTSHKMATTFHPFPRLPPEIRIKIWHAAIRDTSLPGVQFCDIQVCRNGLARTITPLVKAETFTCEDFVFKIGAYANRSALHIDSGLWSACPESRHAMRRVFGIKVPKHLPQDSRPPNAHLLPSTLTIWYSTSTKTHYTYFPFRDLILLPEDVLQTHVTFASVLKLFCNRDSISLHTLRHIGFEYNPAMIFTAPFDRRTMVSMRTTAVAIGPKTAVYIVDHKLRRRKNLAAGKSQRKEKVFTANGGRYIEARYGSEWEYRYEPCGCSSFSLWRPCG